MKQVFYAIQFKGTAAPGAKEGTLRINATGPSCVVTSVVGPEGVDGTIQPAPAANALFESEVTMTGETSFTERGWITFGEGGHRLHFAAVSDGWFGPSPDPQWKHGCVCWRVEGGDGMFEGAGGLVTSNFVFNDAGEVTDQQFGVIFVRRTLPDKTEFEGDRSKSTFDQR